MTHGRRRRGLLLIGASLACGAAAAGHVQDRAAQVEAQVGGLVPVLVARHDLAADTRLAPERLPGMLAVRQVPRRFAPPDALSAPADAAGLRLAAPVPAGGYVTAGAFDPGEVPDDRAGVARGERSLDVAVAGGEALGEAPPGARVDVLVTSEDRAGAGRTVLALEAVELLAIRPPSDADADGAASRATAVATLRVEPRQAVYLTAAQSFAREIRLLVRPPGDRDSLGPLEVDGGDV